MQEGVKGTATTEMAAGIDLGSNSFHMIVARLDHGQLNILDRVRERVRLAAGLGKRGNLTAKKRAQALACLARFAERLQGLSPDCIRAVGTNTLRQARNSREFLEEAGEALGHPIEVISGHEEARLIYLGVAHTLQSGAGRRLVVDIGGGSTECILGERFVPLFSDSLFMGCVSYTRRFFPDGRITEEAMAEAELAAKRELSSIEQRYTKRGWRDAIGSSGTVHAIARILKGRSVNGGGATTPKALGKLRKELIAQGDIKNLSLDGLDADRAPVLPGGFAILNAVFGSLGIERMTPSPGALREGLVYDLIGPVRHEDVRTRTIERFCETYNVDRQHAGRVKRLALELLDQVGLGWGVDMGMARRYLGWAAELHEIGLSLSHTGYHKHGAYIVTHANMPGFSRDDQQILATLIRLQRRKISRALLRDLPLPSKAALRVCALFRLAVCLRRSRSPERLGSPTLSVKKKDRFQLRFPRGWLAAHPLTAADLTEEAARLAAVGITLEAA